MTVYLVGGGPGDPRLVTVRGAQVLAGADVVVHDGLADPAVLDLAPAGAERIDVGWRPETVPALLVELARSGRRVVRVTGGDPFVSGGGGQEAVALAAAGVEFEVVPGVTSAVAAAAYAGVPVTHRGVATSFTVVAGDGGTNWEALAGAGGTILILPGVAPGAEIAARLMAGGLAPSTPAAAVSLATRPEQRSARTTLEHLGRLDLSPPATVVVGGVAALDASWYERLPLFGRRVVVTRARAQAFELSARLLALGARPLEVPTIAIGPPADGGAALDDAAAALAAGAYRWVVFTSANAVDPLLGRLHDARDFRSAAIAAIGPGTAAALARWHLRADLVPAEFVAESLLDAFPAGEGRVLLPRAAVARDVLPAGLADKGWQVEVVEGYRTERQPPGPGDREAVAAADAVTFTSSSTVEGYVAAGLAVPPVVACIGPVTARTARRLGLPVTVEASPHTLDGLTAALARALLR